jgi:hypothetical protein
MGKIFDLAGVSDKTSVSRHAPWYLIQALC